MLDALPGLGKTTAALAFGRWFHREQIDLHGPLVQAGGGTWQRIPVAYLGLTSHTTMRSLNAMLCRFYGLPPGPPRPHPRTRASHPASRPQPGVIYLDPAWLRRDTSPGTAPWMTSPPRSAPHPDP